MPEEDIYYINGAYVPAGKAAIPVNDLALLRGYGVFDFMRTYGKKPFCIEEHISRLKESARLTGIPFPWSVEEVIGIVKQTLDRNRHDESNIRVVVTGGPSPDFLSPGGKPRLLVLVSKLRPLPREWYSRGVRVITIARRRSIPGAKTINYLSAIIALEDARKQGAAEAICVDGDGTVLEGQTATIFTFIGDRLLTNEKGILPGVTRGLILRLTESVFEQEIRDQTIGDLRGADEIFMTASNKEVVPVVGVDDTVISGGTPGPRTRRVMELFREYTRRFAAGEI
ncbi:MAG: aminotransferase class IV [PVC group bacterium]